jgi:signal transduction histidine kinase
VEVRVQDRGLLLSIRDNGAGFTVSDHEGMGLSIMKYRTSMVGGVLRVDSQPGAGCRVTCQVPHPHPEYPHES